MMILWSGAREVLPVSLLELAQGLATSAFWQDMVDPVLVVKAQKISTLAVLGQFDDAARARLTFLSRWLGEVASSLCFIDYPQVEQVCEKLALKLQAALGSERLRYCSFTAIPRGGFVVIGLLSYSLRLAHHQLVEPVSRAHPLVIVDDCSLSGAGFYRFLQKCSHPEVVFASLYAHPDLCRAIEAQEPRVIACINGQDLQDYAPARYGSHYLEWRTQAAQRLEHRYWIGQTEELCFPWSEPDHNFWNPITETMEDGWRLFPPQRCLKNRFTDSPAIPVQVQAKGCGSLKPSDEVLVGHRQGQIVLSHLETGESHLLKGVAIDIWQALMTSESLEAAVTTLGSEYEVEADVLEADVKRFNQSLLDQGFLTYE